VDRKSDPDDPFAPVPGTQRERLHGGAQHSLIIPDFVLAQSGVVHADCLAEQSEDLSIALKSLFEGGDGLVERGLGRRHLFSGMRAEQRGLHAGVRAYSVPL
jgi:hypothetical protein